MSTTDRDTARAQQSAREHLFYATPEIQQRLAAAIAQALAEVRAEPAHRTTGEKRSVVVPAYFDNLAERDAYRSGYLDALAQPAPERREEQP